MEKLKRIQRIKLTLPIRNISVKEAKSLTESVRTVLYDFRQQMDDGEMLETLRWFIFNEYASPLDEWLLASCPTCHSVQIPIKRKSVSSDGKCACPQCSGVIWCRAASGASRGFV